MKKGSDLWNQGRLFLAFFNIKVELQIIRLALRTNMRESTLVYFRRRKNEMAEILLLLTYG